MKPGKEMAKGRAGVAKRQDCESDGGLGYHYLKQIWSPAIKAEMGGGGMAEAPIGICRNAAGGRSSQQALFKERGCRWKDGAIRLLRTGLKVFQHRI